METTFTYKSVIGCIIVAIVTISILKDFSKNSRGVTRMDNKHLRIADPYSRARIMIPEMPGLPPHACALFSAVDGLDIYFVKSFISSALVTGQYGYLIQIVPKPNASVSLSHLSGNLVVGQNSNGRLRDDFVYCMSGLYQDATNLDILFRYWPIDSKG